MHPYKTYNTTYLSGSLGSTFLLPITGLICGIVLQKMKATTKNMSSAKATTRHAVRAITGKVNAETEMVDLVNGAIGSDIEQFYSPTVFSCTRTTVFM